MLEIFSEIKQDSVINGGQITFSGRNVIVCFWTSSELRSLAVAENLQSMCDSLDPEHFAFIGVHTPEFQFGKQKEHVSRTLGKKGIKYQNVIDNDYNIWSYFNNQFWPSVYIFNDIGELIGEFTDHFEMPELWQFLMELSQPEPETDEPHDLQIPDVHRVIYLGSAQGEIENSPRDTREGISLFETPDRVKPGATYLSGSWMISQEYAEGIHGDGTIIIHDSFRSASVVAGSTNGGKIILETGGKREEVLVNDPGIYSLMENSDLSEKHIKLEISEGVRVYSLAFQ